MTIAQIAYFNRFLKENGLHHKFYMYMRNPMMVTSTARELMGSFKLNSDVRIRKYLEKQKWASAALIHSFVFDRTNEGGGFWHQMSQKYEDSYDREYSSFSRKYYKRHDLQTN